MKTKINSNFKNLNKANKKKYTNTSLRNQNNPDTNANHKALFFKKI